MLDAIAFNVDNYGPNYPAIIFAKQKDVIYNPINKDPGIANFKKF